MQALSVGSEENVEMNQCANCGKEEGEGGNGCEGASTITLKKCNACKMVKYCGRDCQIAHRAQHKKACNKRVAELYDETLFKEPPPTEDCPICQIPLPLDRRLTSFKSCCGKSVCMGCTHAWFKEEIMQGKDIDDTGTCAFCRVIDADTDGEMAKRVQLQVNKGNAHAHNVLARYYATGENGFPINRAKSMELSLKGGELGDPSSYYNLGNMYNQVGDIKKAMHYYGLAAIKGNLNARANLAKMEGYASNDERAYKHFLIAARGGDVESLSKVRMGITRGFVTKEEYGVALRAYQQRKNETKSEMRDEALVYQANPTMYAGL